MRLIAYAAKLQNASLLMDAFLPRPTTVWLDVFVLHTRPERALKRAMVFAAEPIRRNEALLTASAQVAVDTVSRLHVSHPWKRYRGIWPARNGDERRPR